MDGIVGTCAYAACPDRAVVVMTLDDGGQLTSYDRCEYHADRDAEAVAAFLPGVLVSTCALSEFKGVR